MALGKVSVDGEEIGSELDVVVVKVGGVLFFITAPHGDGIVVEVDCKRIGVSRQGERSIQIRGAR